jgi:hypothetical protein
MDPTPAFCIPFAFPPVVDFDPAWRTETVMALARGIEAEVRYDRMPILADALQDAGCENEKVLNHCRLCEGHDRDCWVMTLIFDRGPKPLPFDDPRIIAILREAAQPSPYLARISESLTRPRDAQPYFRMTARIVMFGFAAVLIVLFITELNRKPKRNPLDAPLFQTPPTFDFKKQQELAEQLTPPTRSDRP